MNRALRLQALAVAAVLSMAAAVSLSACGSSSKSDSGTPTTTSDNGLSIDTPEGRATLALNGELPTGWPSSFPVPAGSTPKGSGSLVTENHNVMIGVYASTLSPRDAFDFYTSNPSLTVESPNSVGVGRAFFGELSLGGDHAGTSVVVIPGGDGSYITGVVKPADTGTNTTSSPATPTSTQRT